MTKTLRVDFEWRLEATPFRSNPVGSWEIFAPLEDGKRTSLGLVTASSPEFVIQMTAALLRHCGCEETARLVGAPFLPPPGRTIEEVLVMGTNTPIRFGDWVNQQDKPRRKKKRPARAQTTAPKKAADPAPKSLPPTLTWNAVIKRWPKADEAEQAYLLERSPPPHWSKAIQEAWPKLDKHLKLDIIQTDVRASEAFARFSGLAPLTKQAKAEGTTLEEKLRSFVKLEEALRRDPEQGLLMILQKEAERLVLPPEEFRPFAAQRMADISQSIARMPPELWRGAR